MNISKAVGAGEVVSLGDPGPIISAKNLTIDFPIYDARSRSLSYRLMVKPVTNVVRALPRSAAPSRLERAARSLCERSTTCRSRSRKVRESG
jgi:hypothetical protein